MIPFPSGVALRLLALIESADRCWRVCGRLACATAVLSFATSAQAADATSAEAASAEHSIGVAETSSAGEAQTTTQAASLAAAVPTQESVTVTGTRRELVHGARDTSSASTVLLRADLEKPGATAASVLSLVPGVSVLRAGSAGEFATASIRGTESRQIPVYLAGIRLNDDVGGSADLSSLPLWMVQRVEVYRGNAPQEADRSGLAGAIFFEPLHPSGPALGGNVSVGSYAERSAWINAANGNSRASSLLAVRYSHADNNYPYLNDHGQRFQLNETRERRRNADYSDYDVWSVSDYAPSKRLQLTVLLNALNREQGATSISTTPAEHARTELNRLLAGLRGTLLCGLSESCKLEFHISSLFTGTETLDPALELRTSGGPWIYHRGTRHTQSLRFSAAPLDDLSLHTTVEHASESLALHRQGEHNARSSREEVGVSFSAVGFESRALTPQLLLRARCHFTRATYQRLNRPEERDSARCNANPPDARAGLRLRLAESNALLANVAHVTQEPTLGELYGVNPSVFGNPELQPEVSNNVDLGIQSRFGTQALDVELDTFIFGRWATQLIRYRQTSLNAFSPFNEGSARILGAEGTLAARLFQHLSSRTTFTALDPRRTDGSTPNNAVLALLPRLRLSQELSVNWAWPSIGIENSSLTLRYLHTSTRYADKAGFVVLPRQQQLDASGSLSLSKLPIRVQAAVENLTNRESLDMLGLPLPGISYHAAIEAWWK